MSDSESARDQNLGRLFICPTPIGNLSDAAPRLLETLENVDVIACEDTRVTGKLLNLLSVSYKAKLVKYHDHNAHQVAQYLVESHLLKNNSVALATDAGTPAISDPGYLLVNAAWEHNLEIVALPGPCAAIVALSASGLPTDRFTFVGFAPTKLQKRRDWLAQCLTLNSTVVGYESPHRIIDFVNDLNELAPDAKLYVGRELTKLNEEHLRGTPAQILEVMKQKEWIKGEVVFAFSYKEELVDSSSKNLDIRAVIADLQEANVHPKIIKELASKWFDMKKSDVFSLIEDIKKNSI